MSRIEELSSDSEGTDEFFKAMPDPDPLSDDDNDDFQHKNPLDDFETIDADSARRAAASGNPIQQNLNQEQETDQDKADEPLIVEELPEEVMQERIANAEALKAQGNEFYQQQKWEEAIEKYTQAFEMAPKNHPSSAVYLSNRAACRVSLGQWRFVIEDTTLALRLQPDYVKAIARRAQAYEETNQLQEALDDLKKLIELDPSFKKVTEPRIKRLEKEIEIKRQKETEEMMGQLKDMGNKFLGLFGLSLDNFKAEKDPSGSYKINFSQK